MRSASGLSAATGPVARVRDANGGIAGTGFLIGDRHVMTCAHVLDDAFGRNRGTETAPEAEVALDLPFLDRLRLCGTIVAWYPMTPLGTGETRPAISDIAVIELAEPVKGGVDPRDARIAEPGEGRAFCAYGFPAGMDDGAEAGGELRMRDAGGWRQIRDVQTLGYFVQPGFSGAPVFDARTSHLLGMVVAADADEERRLAFAIPTSSLASAWPLLVKPYKELAAFGPTDAELFFGRDRFVDELEVKVLRRPFLTVIGPSGSGKSSVVMAGLMPQLQQRGGWAIATCRPRRRPLYHLAHAIAAVGADTDETRGALHTRTEDLERQFREDPGRIVDVVESTLGTLPRVSRLLLVIDQFEELFTLDADATEVSEDVKENTISARVEEFIAVLEAIGKQSDKAPSINAVATLRADFTGQALKNRALAELMRDADVKLGPMTPAELARAIEAPATLFGVSFETGLVPEIVAEMARSPGGLPLMQFALARLWQRQRDRFLWREDYSAIRGVEGALAEHAEAFWSDCSEADGDRLRRILLRLVRLAPPGEQSEDTRAVALRSEIGEADWPMVHGLVEARLAMTGRDPVSEEVTVEVVHEALIRAWPRLKTWLDEDREFGLWRQRLQTYLADHATRGTVLTGDLLTEAEAWRTSHAGALNPKEIALIKASIGALRTAEDAAASRQRTWIRRLAALSAFLAFAAGAAGYFWWEAGTAKLAAQNDRDRAQAALLDLRELRAAQLLAASERAFRVGEIQKSVAFAESARSTINNETELALTPSIDSAIQRGRLRDLFIWSYPSNRGPVTFLGNNPKSNTLLATSWNGYLTALDTTSGHPLFEKELFEAPVSFVSEIDEKRQLIGSLSGALAVFDVQQRSLEIIFDDLSAVRRSEKMPSGIIRVFTDDEIIDLPSEYLAWPTSIDATESGNSIVVRLANGHVLIDANKKTLKHIPNVTVGEARSCCDSRGGSSDQRDYQPYYGVHSSEVDEGRIVTHLTANSAASRSKLRVGDIITSVDGFPTLGAWIDSGGRIGDRVSITYSRNGVLGTLEIVVGWRLTRPIDLEFPSGTIREASISPLGETNQFVYQDVENRLFVYDLDREMATPFPLDLAGAVIAVDESRIHGKIAFGTSDGFVTISGYQGGGAVRFYAAIRPESKIGFAEEERLYVLTGGVLSIYDLYGHELSSNNVFGATELWVAGDAAVTIGKDNVLRYWKSESPAWRSVANGRGAVFDIKAQANGNIHVMQQDGSIVSSGISEMVTNCVPANSTEFDRQISYIQCGDGDLLRVNWENQAAVQRHSLDLVPAPVLSSISGTDELMASYANGHFLIFNTSGKGLSFSVNSDWVQTCVNSSGLLVYGLTRQGTIERIEFSFADEDISWDREEVYHGSQLVTSIDCFRTSDFILAELENGSLIPLNPSGHPVEVYGIEEQRLAPNAKGLQGLQMFASRMVMVYDDGLRVLDLGNNTTFEIAGETWLSVDQNLAAATRDGRYIAVAHDSNLLEVWDLEYRNRVFAQPLDLRHLYTVKLVDAGGVIQLAILEQQSVFREGEYVNEWTALIASIAKDLSREKFARAGEYEFENSSLEVPYR